VAAYGIVQGEQVLLRGLVAAPDGKSVIRVQEQGIDPHEVGQRAAAAALSQGAGVILNV
jgi:porphobilinogen deaminase